MVQVDGPIQSPLFVHPPSLLVISSVLITLLDHYNSVPLLFWCFTKSIGQPYKPGPRSILLTSPPSGMRWPCSTTLGCTVLRSCAFTTGRCSLSQGWSLRNFTLLSECHQVIAQDGLDITYSNDTTGGGIHVGYQNVRKFPIIAVGMPQASRRIVNEKQQLIYCVFCPMSWVGLYFSTQEVSTAFWPVSKATCPYFWRQRARALDTAHQFG